MKINQQTIEWIKTRLPEQHFDSVALGMLDLDSFDYETIQVGKRFESNEAQAYFDLASLTKPLSFFPWLDKFPKLFNPDRLLLLNHQAGLPLSGRLHQDTWAEQVLSYEIRKSPTLYSDFSPLRLMLELEREQGINSLELVKEYVDKEVKYWRELNSADFIIPTGQRNGSEILGQAHDDKAFMIQRYTAHAGLFSTIDGLMRTLKNWCKSHGLVDKIVKANNKSTERFALGWDTVTDPSTSLAGKKSELKTFGHLGFTGTSIWISPVRKKAICLLTNETQGFWYDRKNLASFRRELYDSLWDADS